MKKTHNKLIVSIHKFCGMLAVSVLLNVSPFCFDESCRNDAERMYESFVVRAYHRFIEAVLSVRSDNAGVDEPA